MTEPTRTPKREPGGRQRYGDEWEVSQDDAICLFWIALATFRPWAMLDLRRRFQDTETHVGYIAEATHHILAGTADDFVRRLLEEHGTNIEADLLKFTGLVREWATAWGLSAPWVESFAREQVFWWRVIERSFPGPEQDSESTPEAWVEWTSFGYFGVPNSRTGFPLAKDRKDPRIDDLIIQLQTAFSECLPDRLQPATAQRLRDILGAIDSNKRLRSATGRQEVRPCHFRWLVKRLVPPRRACWQLFADDCGDQVVWKHSQRLARLLEIDVASRNSKRPPNRIMPDSLEEEAT